MSDNLFAPIQPSLSKIYWIDIGHDSKQWQVQDTGVVC